jgi:predicted AlkP superfamily pyrophosphatase or phosphodiesterase
MPALGLILAALLAQEVEHVVIVSIDGLRPDFYLGDYETPTLRAMMREGVHAREAESVYPSSTYPAHASIVTGVRPWKHGIGANTQWGENGALRDWHWFAKHLQARTLWDAAREKGRKVAITYWPSSVGAEADWVLGEIWDPDTKDTVKRLTAAATPGLLLELMLALGVPEDRLAADKAGIDRFVSRAAAYKFRRYKPNLQLVHLLNVDEAQHKEGREGPGVRAAVKEQDANLAVIRRAIAESGLGSKTLLVVTGDHGFADVKRNINPNALLRDAGYVEAEGGHVKSWRALARSSGGSCSVYVKDPADAPAVGELLRKAAVAGGEILYEVLDRAELDRLGYNRDAAFALDPADGWAFSGAFAPRLVDGLPTVRGNHGQRPTRPGLFTGFVAAGAGVRPGASVDRMRLIDIAPTVARLLRLEMPDVEGVPLDALLR